MAMGTVLCKQASLFPGGGKRCCMEYTVGKVIPNVKSIQGKTIIKEFDWVEERRVKKSTCAIC